MIREIYTSSLTQERKIELLQEFHQHIEDVLAVDRKLPFGTFSEKWKGKLKRKP